MNNIWKKIFIFVSSLLYFVIPYVGSRIKWQGTEFPDTPEGFPPGYGLFTDQKIVEPPPFNETYFLIVAVLAAIATIFLLFPSLFGFKTGVSESALPKSGNTQFPPWFWPSLIIMSVSWIAMWSRWPHPFDVYSFVPLWWGFIFFLDALVYKRNNGKSIYSTRPGTFKLIFAVSSVAWFSFEYINFFYVELWYYPNNAIFTNFGFIFWYLLSFTVVWPGIFEFYTLLRTFPFLKNRYANGPKIIFPMWVQISLLLSGFILAFVSVLYPREMFWAIWVYPLLVVSTVLSLAGYWNIFSPIKKGDWSLVVLIGIATLCNGVFYEMWNEGSEWFHPSLSDNPNFWMYSIPYLDKYYIFSRMPVIGYYGYIVFGSVVWQIWLLIANFLDFSPDFDPTVDVK